MQVLKTLQVLLQGNFTMQELIERLNKSEEEPVFNNSVISKYINTCRYCGINILKFITDILLQACLLVLSLQAVT